MEVTISASILKGSRVFRYIRVFDPKFEKLIFFTLPSIGSSSCIVKVEMTFRQLQFCYNISCYDIVNGINIIKEEGLKEIDRIPTFQSV